MIKLSLPEMGWKPFFQQQLTMEDYEHNHVARVVAVHRDRINVISEESNKTISYNSYWLSLDSDEKPTVGDWILLKNSTESLDRLLERQSLIQRISPGTEPKPQLIAANIDTLFVVSSCNHDLNDGRLERYLALAISSGVQPVVVLTKADLTEHPETFLEQAQQIRKEVPVICVNAMQAENLTELSPWLTKGATVAFVGSSGVGKSTITNTLMTEQVQLTHGIREDDAKGRHTTTSRNMLLLPSGTWIIDTPGMRELRLGDDQLGVEAVFSDIEQLAAQCRFSDCHHQGDQGCAISKAIETDQLDPKRLERYLKLIRETQHAKMTQLEHRQKNKAFGKMIKRVMTEKNRKR